MITELQYKEKTLFEPQGLDGNWCFIHKEKPSKFTISIFITYISEAFLSQNYSVIRRQNKAWYYPKNFECSHEV